MCCRKRFRGFMRILKSGEQLRKQRRRQPAQEYSILLRMGSCLQGNVQEAEREQQLRLPDTC